MLKGWYQQLEKTDRFLAILPFVTSYKQWNKLYLALCMTLHSDLINSLSIYKKSSPTHFGIGGSPAEVNVQSTCQRTNAGLA